MKGNPSSTPRTRGMSRDPAGIENAGPSAPALNRAVISSLAEGTNPAVQFYQTALRKAPPGLSPLLCPKSRELDHLDRVQTASERRQLTRALTAATAA